MPTSNQSDPNLFNVFNMEQAHEEAITISWPIKRSLVKLKTSQQLLTHVQNNCNFQSGWFEQVTYKQGLQGNITGFVDKVDFQHCAI